MCVLSPTSSFILHRPNRSQEGEEQNRYLPFSPMTSSQPPSKKTEEVDKPLIAVGFELDVVSATLVSGHLEVTEICSQHFGVLHGGVSALISESLASIGAHLASGFKRVAGVQLSINHHKSANIGDHVVAEAKPLRVGRSIQVWDVQLWKSDSSTSTKKEVMIASSRVTLLTNLPVPETAKDAEVKLRRHAKL